MELQPDLVGNCVALHSISSSWDSQIFSRDEILEARHISVDTKTVLAHGSMENHE